MSKNEWEIHLPKQFGLTAKSFFCFARAELNVITYEKQDIQQTRTKAFTP